MTDRFTLTLALLVATAIWGGTFVLVQDAVEGYSVLSFLALRFAVASLALLPFALRASRGVGKMARDWKIGVPAGIVFALGMLLQSEGLRTTTSTSSGLITGLYVVFAPLLALALFGVYPGRRIWLAVALSAAGLALVAGERPDALRVGDGLTLLSAATFGLHIALLSRYAPGTNVVVLAWLQAVVATAFCLPAALLAGASLLPERSSVWIAILVTGLGATAFGNWVQAHAQARLTAARVAIVLSLESVFAALTGYLYAGDRLSPVQWAGASLLLLALVVAELAPYLRLFRLAPGSRRRLLAAFVRGSGA